MRATWLLIGFLLMFSFPIGEFTLFPLGGFLLILFAVLRLEKFEPTFKRSRYALYAAIPVSAFVFALQIYKTALGENVAVWYEWTYVSARILCELSEIAVMLFIYLGINIIGRNADVPALEKHSRRNLTVMLVYIVSEILITLLKNLLPQLFVGFEIILVYPFVLGYVWRALNVWTAFTLLNKITVENNRKEQL